MKNMIKKNEVSIPVSYTHLDVYKRQASISSSLNMVNNCGIVKIHAAYAVANHLSQEGCVFPVSQKH